MVRRQLLLVSLFVLVISIEAQETRSSSLVGCSPIPGECSAGAVPLSESLVENVDTCWNQCIHTESCKYYTFHPDDGTCLLQSECPEVSSVSCTGSCVTGNIECICDRSGAVQGSSIGLSFPADSLSCAKECSDSSECIWWTYDPLDSSCALHKDCEYLDDIVCPECLSGEKSCYNLDPSVGNGLVVTGGRNLVDWAFSSVEVVVLGDQRVQCPSVPDMPIPLCSASGFLHQGNPAVCGGDYLNPYCFLFNLKTWKWEILAELPITVEKAAGVKYDENFLLTGGTSIYGYFPTTSLFNGTVEEFRMGMVLPYPVLGHCITKLNETHAVLNGGVIDFDSMHSVLMLDLPSETWTQLPNLNKERADHCCGLASTDSGLSYVVVAGGYPNGRSVEILDLDTLTWSPGHDLPLDIVSAYPVQYQDSFLIIGGEGNNTIYKSIWQYDPNSSGDPWYLRPEELTIERSSEPVSFVVPLADLKCK